MSTLSYGVVSVYDHQGLIPHFLEHYRRLGVTHMFLCARTELAQELASESARHFDGFASVHYKAAEFFSDAEKGEFELSVLDRHHVEADDYILHLDLDEFQEYPAPLAEVIVEMNRANHWACRGWIVDRLARDGTLQPVQASPSIWEQFPVVADITGALLNGWCQKIVICRRRVRLKGSCRHDTENAYHDIQPVPGAYVVHHFKWVEGLIRRIENRLEREPVSDAYRRECRCLLAYFERNGRFDLSDPVLNARSNRNAIG